MTAAPPTGSVDPSMFREYDIRGFVDENLTAPVLSTLGRAYGTFLSGLPGAGEKGPGTVAVGRVVVGMRGDVVDVFVGVLEDGRLPLAERLVIELEPVRARHERRVEEAYARAHDRSFRWVPRR